MIDIVEFVELLTGVKLLIYQKALLLKVYEMHKENPEAGPQIYYTRKGKILIVPWKEVPNEQRSNSISKAISNGSSK